MQSSAALQLPQILCSSAVLVVLAFVRHRYAHDRGILRKTGPSLALIGGNFWLIDLSLVNAYILYRDECADFKQKPMSRKKFHKAVAESLFGDYEPAAPPKSRESSQFLVFQ